VCVAIAFPTSPALNEKVARLRFDWVREGIHPASRQAQKTSIPSTRYNWSCYYAMAVIELAEAVAREVQNRP
jgi:hypothetical protein